MSKKKLKARLRKLDSQITALDWQLRWCCYQGYPRERDLLARRDQLDAKRKETRLTLKGYVSD